MRRAILIGALLALMPAIAAAQTSVVTAGGATQWAPVIVIPASAVNGAGILSTTCLTFALGTTVCEPAANALEQRVGTNAQAFRSYNTYTDASNYERANLGWASNAFSVTVGAAGSGSSRSIIVGTDSTSSGNLTFQTAGTNRWQIPGSGSTGHLLAVGADNTYDIGAAGANRPRTGYYGTSLNVAAGLTLKATADKLTQVNDNANATGLELNLGTPTLGTCTGGTLVSGSHNFGGEVTGNTSGSCILNFGTPNFTNTPFCFINDETTLTAVRISARSASSITITGAVSADAFQYFCVGRIGT